MAKYIVGLIEKSTDYEQFTAKIDTYAEHRQHGPHISIKIGGQLRTEARLILSDAEIEKIQAWINALKGATVES